MREDVRDDAILAGIVRQAGRLPLLPGAREELEQRGVVHGLDRRVVVGNGSDDLGPCRHERLADRVGPLRHLHGRCPHADPDLGRRVVQPVVVRPDERDRERHGGDVIGSTA